ncbi:MAG: GNAT family N-acetyltransferase [Dokdonella sp.]
MQPNPIIPANILETERLSLRQLTPDDNAFVFELVTEPAWIRNIGDRGVSDLESATRYIVNGPMASYAKFGFGLYLVARKDGDIPVGICGLLKRETLDDVDIGFAFLQRHWGNGYAVESARAVMAHGRQTLALKRIVAITAPHNDASMRVLEKIGMRLENTITQPGHSEPSNFFASEA